jgi:hypothetical protein
MTLPVSIPDAPSFEEAIALTQTLLAAMMDRSVAEADLQGAIAQLVSTHNGARGFFVAYLTDDRPLADQPSPGVIAALQGAAAAVADLLVKNLAMSSAMAIAHRRRQAEDMAQGSDRVRSRTLGLIRQLQSAVVAERVAALQGSLAGEGDYSSFLERWGYDADQRQAIGAALEAIAAEET